jgi:RNA polymerase sigma factor (TIGR02999 family)
MGERDVPPDVTVLLGRLRGGDANVVDSLLPLVYDELRSIARRQLRRERADHTLNATALVHEAYLKLVGQRAEWQNRAHFFGVAAQAMRRILVNYAQRRLAGKRGGGAELVTFEDELVAGRSRAEDVLDLDEALERLAAKSARQATGVVYRFFGGMTQEEIAEALGVSVQTVRLDWRMARAWLSRELAAR